MKKAAIIFLISSAFIFELEAQFSIGLTGGINLSKTRFINFGLDSESVIYYFAGLTPGYQLSEKISLITEVQYSPKGYKEYDTISQSDYKVKFTYLDFLPQIEYRFHKNISVGAGCNIGVKISEDIKLDNEAWFANEDYEYVRSIDFGLVAAAKYHINNFHFLARINYGLMNISDLVFTDINGQILDGTKIKNMNIQLGAGYAFN